MLQRSGKRTAEAGVCRWPGRAIGGDGLQLSARLHVGHVRCGNDADTVQLEGDLSGAQETNGENTGVTFRVDMIFRR